MTPRPHILVGLDLHVDGSGLTLGSALAAEHAFWLAGALGAEVTFLHSTQGDRYLEQNGRTVLVHEGVSPRADASIEALTRRFAAAGFGGEFVMREERPWMAIVQEALRLQPTVVVLGKHDDAETAPRLGSVAAKVLHACPCAVWVVKPGTHVPPRRILAASDLSGVGENAVAEAAKLARAASAELHLAHVYQLSMEEQLRSAREEGVFDDAQQRAEKGLSDQAALVTAGLERVEQHVGCNEPVRALKALVAGIEPDLLVMGTVSRGGLPGLLMGNTAERVLPRVACSILAVKPPDFVSPIQPKG